MILPQIPPYRESNDPRSLPTWQWILECPTHGPTSMGAWGDSSWGAVWHTKIVLDGISISKYYATCSICHQEMENPYKKYRPHEWEILGNERFLSFEEGSV